jgi:HEAT repeat protein
MEQADKDREQAGEWTRKIRLWQRWLGTRREGEALEQLLRLSDPSTTPIVIDMLASEENPALRKLWIQVLGNLATPPAATALLGNSLADPRRDVRRASLEQLERLRPPQATAFYTAALRRSDVAMVRRAALALQRLGNESAVRPLIDALVTEHKVVIPPGNPNEINTIFGSGSASSGTGFSTGSRATVEKRRFANREALDALIQITGQNFQYDQDAWRRWYTERDAPLATINLRRDP